MRQLTVNSFFTSYLILVYLHLSCFSPDGPVECCLYDAGDMARPEYTMHDEERQLTEADLSRAVCLKLSETSTMWLLDMPSICVMSESDEALEIIRQNSRYEAVSRFILYSAIETILSILCEPSI